MSERRTVTASEPTIRRMASKLPSLDTTIVTNIDGRGSGGMNWMSTWPAAGLLTGSASCHGIESVLATRRRQCGEPVRDLAVFFPERRDLAGEVRDLGLSLGLALGQFAIKCFGRLAPILGRLLVDRSKRFQIPLGLSQSVRYLLALLLGLGDELLGLAPHPSLFVGLGPRREFPFLLGDGFLQLAPVAFEDADPVRRRDGRDPLRPDQEYEVRLPKRGIEAPENLSQFVRWRRHGRPLLHRSSRLSTEFRQLGVPIWPGIAPPPAGRAPTD